MQKTLNPGGLKLKIGVFLLPALLFLADRGIKNYVEHSLPLEGAFWIPRFLGIELFRNPGLAFGIPLQPALIIALSLLAFVLAITSVRSHKKTVSIIFALELVLLGGSSNFYDRVANGYVIDYLRIGPISVINLADIMVLTGITLLVIHQKNAKNGQNTHFD
jgi:lipoprotein signal peptidase